MGLLTLSNHHMATLINLPRDPNTKRGDKLSDLSVMGYPPFASVTSRVWQRALIKHAH